MCMYVSLYLCICAVYKFPLDDKDKNLFKKFE